MENKKASLLNILIDFFASLYDLAIVVFVSLTDFFASLYDLVGGFMSFIWEYLEWVTTIETIPATDFKTPAEESIKVNNQNPFISR